MFALIEKTTDDLWKLPRSRTNIMRLVTLPTLRQFSNVDGSLKISKQGVFMLDWLKSGVRTIPQLEIEGNPVEPPQARLAIELTLGLASKWLTLPERDVRVLTILGSPFPVGQMHRHWSPRRELLRGLAAHLVSQSTEKPN